MNFFIDSIRSERDYDALTKTLEEQLSGAPKPIVVSGLCTGAANAFYACVAEDAKRYSGACPLIIVADDGEGMRLCSFFESIGREALYFPRRELVFHNITASHESEHERLSALYRIAKNEPDVIITTPDAALGYTISRDRLLSQALHLSVGDIVAEDDIAKKLISAGYVRVDMVEGTGQFSVRGDIVDIFPPSYDAPLRAEFFGDEINRLCTFDPETQRMSQPEDEATVLPAREFTANADARDEIAKTARKLAARAKSENAREILRGEAECAESGLPMMFADKYLPLIADGHTCLLDHIPGKRAVITVESNNVKDRLDGYLSVLDEEVKGMLGEGVVSPALADYTNRGDRLDIFRQQNAHIIVNSFGTAGLSGRAVSGVYGFSSRRGVSYNGNIRLLTEDIGSLVRGKYRIGVLCASESSASLTASAIGDEGFPAVKTENISPRDMKPGVVYVSWGVDIEGYELPAQKLSLLSFTAEPDSTKKKRRAVDRRRGTNTEKILSYGDLKVGDYVVHASYGIGQYLGLENLVVDGAARDYVKIKYAGTDLLYLPADQLDLVSKYIGAHAEDGAVKLSKMGGAEWVRAKSRAKSAAKDMAKELIALYAARRRTKGFAFPPDDDYQRGFEESFEYEETDAQLAAVEDIKRDMEKPYPMDRLLCGDVGYGKTEVALRAAFKAIVAGKQVALLVPTTILAFQHYNTATGRMRPYPITVEMLSRFRTKEQQAEILRRLRRGEIDMIVGTHRIISEDIKFRDLGLLIVDEEQRFGVAQKEKLKQMAIGVDVLTLTATPIPRTLNMAMNGIRDMSLLDESPGNRLPVQTYVLEHDDVMINEAIRRELSRGGQVFYLYNRVESIHSVASRIAKTFPDANVTVAHGQMEREQLEGIWQSLLDGDIDVLVCTTIIETGVDVPNANTLIIEDADRLGLAQLHQIRGRVGRSGRRAYAYFTYRRGKALSEVSMQRLEAIREYTEFGAGFRVALRDMEIRGTGSLLGSRQHGHIDSVGYDLYIKILESAVLEEEGKPTPEAPPDCTVDIRLDAFLPPSYVHSGGHRMEMYKKIARIENTADMNDICDELIDRFGDPPAPAMNLLKIALIRGIGRRAGIKSVKENGGALEIKPKDVDFAVWSSLADYCRGLGISMHVIPASEPYITATVSGKVKMIMAAEVIVRKLAELSGINEL